MQQREHSLNQYESMVAMKAKRYLNLLLVVFTNKAISTATRGFEVNNSFIQGDSTVARKHSRNQHQQMLELPVISYMMRHQHKVVTLGLYK